MGTPTYSRTRKHSKLRDDHVDAWLMSYADLITLLFISFAIFVSYSVSKRSATNMPTRGEPVHPYIKQHSGLLELGTEYDELYRNLNASVMSSSADEYIAIEKLPNGIRIDLSAVQFFNAGTADIPAEQMPVLQKIAKTLNDSAVSGSTIEVEGDTDDEPLEHSAFANNWELAAMRATHVVTSLIQAGIDPMSLRAVSYAGNRPLVPNSDVAGQPIEQNRTRNQRVVLTVSDPALSAKN
jgi:chemotaxis protein MotB